MIIHFCSDKDESFFNNEKKLRGKFGERAAQNFMTRRLALESAETLEDYRTTDIFCHELSPGKNGRRKGQLAIDLKGSHGRGSLRLIIKPFPEIPLKVDGGLDWRQVKSIKIIEIVDYHKER